jgi:prepilin-type N-terminal cleavage/methylation domain-containing protein
MRTERGFTLLELIVAFAILALFVLPILEIVAAARVRAVKYTRERAVRDLAQQKLFDRIYYIEPMDAGTFEEEGHPDWTWEIPPPEMVSQGAQSLLQYTIRVVTPQSEAGRTGPRDTGEIRPAFEMSVWTFPSQEWLDEQAELAARGLTE